MRALDITLTERNLVLVAHILAAIVLIGPVTMAASIFPRLMLEGQRDLAEQMHRVTRLYGRGSLLVGLIGIWLAWRMEYFAFAWLQWSTGLFIVAFGLLLAVILPRQAALLRENKEQVERSDVASIRTLTGIYGILWLVVLYLMVAKPS